MNKKQRTLALVCKEFFAFYSFYCKNAIKCYKIKCIDIFIGGCKCEKNVSIKKVLSIVIGTLN